MYAQHQDICEWPSGKGALDSPDAVKAKVHRGPREMCGNAQHRAACTPPTVTRRALSSPWSGSAVLEICSQAAPCPLLLPAALIQSGWPSTHGAQEPAMQLAENLRCSYRSQTDATCRLSACEAPGVPGTVPPRQTWPCPQVHGGRHGSGAPS